MRSAIEWLRGQSTTGSRGGQIGMRTFVGTLKTWANFLEAEGVYAQSPITRVKRPKVARVLRQPFTEPEIMALWAAARLTRTPIRDEALLLLLFDTGMRIGEATSLTLDKVRLDERHLVVGLEGKGRRERLVPIGDPTKPGGGRAIVALRAWLRAREYAIRTHPERAGDRLFLTSAGYPLTAEGGTDAFKRLGAIGGVANAIPHRARHTFATHYLTANPGDEIGLRRIIGHISDDVTSDYVHLSQQTIAVRAGRTSLIESLSAPKQPRQPDLRSPIAQAWGTGPLDLSIAAPAPRHKRVSELLAGLDAAERKALLRALLNSDAA